MGTVPFQDGPTKNPRPSSTTPSATFPTSPSAGAPGSATTNVHPPPRRPEPFGDALLAVALSIVARPHARISSVSPGWRMMPVSVQGAVTGTVIVTTVVVAVVVSVVVRGAGAERCANPCAATAAERLAGKPSRLTSTSSGSTTVDLTRPPVNTRASCSIGPIYLSGRNDASSALNCFSFAATVFAGPANFTKRLFPPGPSMTAPSSR